MPNEFSHIFMRGGDKVLKFKQRQCFLTTGKRILKNEKDASSGNRTRAARVAGEHSTTEPTMLFSVGSSQQKSVSTSQEQYGKTFAVGRIRTYAPRGKLISSQSP